VLAWDYDLFFIDPLINFLGSGDENKSNIMRQFLNVALKPLQACKEEKSVVFLHHSTKAGHDEDMITSKNARGSGDIVNMGRMNIAINNVKDSDDLGTRENLVSVVKNNVGFLIDEPLFYFELPEIVKRESSKTSANIINIKEERFL
jgi:RecA-family ATPase